MPYRDDLNFVFHRAPEGKEVGLPIAAAVTHSARFIATSMMCFAVSSGICSQSRFLQARTEVAMQDQYRRQKMGLMQIQVIIELHFLLRCPYRLGQYLCISI